MLLIPLKRSLIIMVIFAAICGVIYPLAALGLAQGTFSYQANGSISRYGSALIGQKFTGSSWFHGRPDPYNPSSTGGTNLGPNSKVLYQKTKALIAFYEARGITPTQSLVVNSGSGLDPDISVNAAYAQAASVARARQLSTSKVDQLVRSETIGRQFGFLGSPYVNVLALNVALSKIK
jgi:K+-transporting ATPase ATPase C chain